MGNNSVLQRAKKVVFIEIENLDIMINIIYKYFDIHSSF